VNRLSEPSDAAASGKPKNLAAPTTTPARAALTSPEKLRLQIMRVQIKLQSLGLYTGQIDGTLNEGTRSALKYFQDVKGLPKSGTMTTPTLNALGVPAAS
jgi:His-Xaa-Ser repeat protein HxsA